MASASSLSASESIAFEESNFEAIKTKNRKVGFIYLWFRAFEYFFRIPANVLKATGYAAFDIPSKFASVCGYLNGMVGNWFQGEQGARDARLCHMDQSQTTEKLLFALVAMTRGTVNLIGDGSSIILQIAENPALRTTAASASTLGHILGFIKNCRDIQIYQGKRRLGYVLCATARPFLVAGAWGLTFTKGDVIEVEPYELLSYLAGLVGMSMFNAGAMIRQNEDIKQYPELLDEYDYKHPSLFFKFFCCRREAQVEQKVELEQANLSSSSYSL